jgi:hypothetical protein
VIGEVTGCPVGRLDLALDRPDASARHGHPCPVLAGRQVARTVALAESVLLVAEGGEPVANPIEVRRHDRRLRRVRIGPVEAHRERSLAEFALEFGPLDADDAREPLSRGDGLVRLPRGHCRPVPRRLWQHGVGPAAERGRRGGRTECRYGHCGRGDDGHDGEHERCDVRTVSTHRDSPYVRPPVKLRRP